MTQMGILYTYGNSVHICVRWKCPKIRDSWKTPKIQHFSKTPLKQFESGIRLAKAPVNTGAFPFRVIFRVILLFLCHIHVVSGDASVCFSDSDFSSAFPFPFTTFSKYLFTLLSISFVLSSRVCRYTAFRTPSEAHPPRCMI